MEYLVGALMAVATIAILVKLFIKNNLVSEKRVSVKYSQAYIHSLVGPVMDAFMHSEAPIKPTQARKHAESTKVRVIFTDSKAYWIANNTFYEAEVVDGIVQNDLAKAVDIMGMDKVQLDKMIFIVEKLTEGKSSDRSNPGDKIF